VKKVPDTVKLTYSHTAAKISSWNKHHGLGIILAD